MSSEKPPIPEDQGESGLVPDVATGAVKRSKLRTISIILTCFSAMTLNLSIVTSSNISLRNIGRDLNIEEDRLQWIPSAYALSAGCFLLLCGRLADLHGRKLTFLLGIAWTFAFAVGCGFVQTEIQLYVLRGLQGIGSAASIPAALGILAQSFPPGRTRSIGFATFSAGAPFGGGLGLTLGGVITQYSSITWRGTFFLTAGMAALSFFAGFFAIDPDLPSTETDRRVDWIGAGLVTIGLVLVTFVLGQGELASDGWRTPYIIALLIIGVFLIAAFLLWEDYLTKHTTRPPLMRLDLWTRANGKFAAIQAIAFLQWSGFMSWSLWLQLYYQEYKGKSPIQTMLAFMPTTVTGLTLNLIVGFVVGWLDIIYLLTIGTAATGGACLLLAVINVNAPYWAFVFPSTILAVWGADFIFSSGTLFVARAAFPHEQSVAGGVLQTLVQLGTSFGLAITTIVHNRTVKRETARLGIVPNRTGSNAPLEATLQGYRNAQWTGFGFVMGALVLSLLFLRNVGVVGGKQTLPHTADDAEVENASNGVEKSDSRDHKEKYENASSEK